VKDDENLAVDFEEREDLRSACIREILLLQMKEKSAECADPQVICSRIPKKLIRFWHDPVDLPDDVLACLESWNRLVDEGFSLHTFHDANAEEYIFDVFGDRERRAFARCTHPAMRCDYFRLCFVLSEGGLYVDADDVLIGDGWRELFRNSSLKLQPLAYDIGAGAMMPSADIWRPDLSISDRVFYANNDPIAAPPNHSVIRRALERATVKLLDAKGALEIQSTTGPGNLTAALASHARELQLAGLPFDFELLRDWDSIAEMRWNLGYRNDARNWRNVYGC
jgi:mannosyltransferase OCH1-like enzyme